MNCTLTTYTNTHRCLYIHTYTHVMHTNTCKFLRMTMKEIVLEIFRILLEYNCVWAYSLIRRPQERKAELLHGYGYRRKYSNTCK